MATDTQWWSELSWAATVDYKLVSDTAEAGVDFTDISGTLTSSNDDIGADVGGPYTWTIQVDVTDDSTADLPETFYFVLYNAECAEIEDHEGIGTIEDNDTVPVRGFVFQDLNGNGIFDSLHALTTPKHQVGRQDTQPNHRCCRCLPPPPRAWRGLQHASPRHVLRTLYFGP